MPETTEPGDFPFKTRFQITSQRQLDFEQGANVHFLTNRAATPYTELSSRMHRRDRLVVCAACLTPPDSIQIAALRLWSLVAPKSAADFAARAESGLIDALDTTISPSELAATIHEQF